MNGWDSERQIENGGKKKKAAAAAKRKLLEILNKYNCILTKTWKERCTKVQSLDNIFFSCF